MADESSGPIAGFVELPKATAYDGGGPSMVDEDSQLIVARIAQKLRDAGLECELVNLAPTEATVLRRDRIVVVFALSLLTVLAWSYLLWLSADMDMGGMDMTGFRMIPSGMGLMMPTHVPWPAIEFACCSPEEAGHPNAAWWRVASNGQPLGCFAAASLSADGPMRPLILLDEPPAPTSQKSD